MRVFITGGTGFVGSHTVAALHRMGHDVRLLVRDPSRVAPALGPLGIGTAALEVTRGDITSVADMEYAIAGCDAVVHAAAVYSFDPRRTDEMMQVNAAATDAVLGSAVQLGLDPIVHVSSIVAVARKGGGTLDPTSPIGNIDGSYPRSKQASDAIARTLQDAGAPIARIMPGSVMGPDDPYLGESDRLVRDVLRGLYPVMGSGRMPYTDVRDLAGCIAAVVDRPGLGPSAWMAPSTTLTPQDLRSRLRRITGRTIPQVVLPSRVILSLMAAARPAIRRMPNRLRVPLPVEGGPDTMAAGNTFDDSATLVDLGVPRTDIDMTIRDTIAWLVQAGHLSRRAAGKALPA